MRKMVRILNELLKSEFLRLYEYLVMGNDIYLCLWGDNSYDLLVYCIVNKNVLLFLMVFYRLSYFIGTILWFLAKSHMLWSCTYLLLFPQVVHECSEAAKVAISIKQSYQHFLAPVTRKYNITDDTFERYIERFNCDLKEILEVRRGNPPGS